MKFNIEKYLVLGQENTNNRPVGSIVEQAIKAGFTFIQIRSKTSTAKELIECCKKTADIIKKLKKEQEVALVVDDRLDIVLACREAGIKVDGIHIGQSDIPVEVCRKYLGKDSIIGLSAPTKDLIEYVKKIDISQIDYFGAGPVHPTQTKPDCGLDKSSGKIIIRTLEELTELAKISPLPIVVGGGVKKNDIKQIKNTGISGFFVVSAITNAEDPYNAAKELVEEWDN